MKKRRLLGLEQLEARETPDVSLCPSAACPLPQLGSRLTALNENSVLASRHLLGTTADDLLDPFAHGRLDIQALETIFSSSEELERLLAPPGETLPVAPSRTAQLITPQSGLDGWRFLSNYTRKAINNDEARYGIVPDHEDIVHQVFVEWREQVGPQDETFRQLLDKDSPERQVLRKTVRRVLDHTRYQLSKQKRIVEFVDQPAPDKPAEQDWIDLQLDWLQGAGNLDARERQMLDLRRQGMTFEEIGSELGLMKQRVCELFTSTLGRLQTLYQVSA